MLLNIFKKNGRCLTIIIRDSSHSTTHDAQIALFTMYASDGPSAPQIRSTILALYKLVCMYVWANVKCIVITRHFFRHMQVWPRARWAIFHWLFGHAACCGILRHVGAKTTQHAERRRIRCEHCLCFICDTINEEMFVNKKTILH